MNDDVARQGGINLWTKMLAAVAAAIDRRFDRRQVVEITDSGEVIVASLDPEVSHRVTAPKMKGVHVEVGDDVLMLDFGGTHTIIGAVRMAGDTSADDSPMGEKGVLALMGQYQPITISKSDAWSATITTNGYHTLPSAVVKFDGLDPAARYTLSADASVCMHTGSSGSAAPALVMTHQSGAVRPAMPPQPVIANSHVYHFSHSLDVFPTAAGEITVVPAVLWGAGSIKTVWASVRATCTRIP